MPFLNNQDRIDYNKQRYQEKKNILTPEQIAEKAAKEDICCCVTFCEFVAAAKKLCDKTCNIACEVLKWPLKDSLCKFHATAKFNGRARAML